MTLNFIKKILLSLSKKKEPKLSKVQIDQLIELNKDTFARMGDELDYDGMGDYGRFPPIKKKGN